MKKEKDYDDTRFSAEAIMEAVATTREIAARNNVVLSNQQYQVRHDDSLWNYDTFEEFLADFRKYKRFAYCSIYGGSIDLSITFTHRETTGPENQGQALHFACQI